MKLKSLIKTTALAASLMTMAQANTTYVMGTESFDEFGQSQAMQITTSGERSHFKICDVTLQNDDSLDFDCNRIGKKEGYSNEELDQIKDSISTEKKLQYVGDALMIAGVAINFKIASKNMIKRQTTRWDNGSHLFSKLDRSYLRNNIATTQKHMFESRALLLVAGLGAKAVILDDAAEKEEALETLERRNEQTPNGSVVMIEDYDAEESADLISRALNDLE